MTPPHADSENRVPASWKPGDVILGLYEVEGVIGRGGMGTVYKVRHRGWGIDLAVKGLRPDMLKNARAAEYFERECDMWVNLGLHPNIASCFYVRRVGRLPHVFAEYIPGGTLFRWIQRKHLYRGRPEQIQARMLDIALQFAWGLRYAHSQGLVHQDVKNANVLMTADGVAKVTDFGLAKAVVLAAQDAESEDESQSSVRGTSVYCSPEQARLEPLTIATDIWSWAVSVLEMYVGEVTWMAGQAADLALETYVELGPEDEGIPPMPAALVDVLRRCFQQAPDKRPAGFQPIIDALAAVYRAVTGQEYPRTPPKPERITSARLNNRAVSSLDLGKRKEAEELWRTVLDAEPTHPEAVYNRTLHRWRRGAMTDMAAVRTLQDLCEKHPRAPLPQYMLAQVHLEREDCEMAVQILEALKDVPVEGHDVASDLARAQEGLASSRRLLGVLGRHTHAVACLCLSWDGTLALAGGGARGQAGELRLWELESGSCINQFDGHKDIVTSACFSADGLYVVSASADGTLRQWRPSGGDCVRVFKGHDGPVLGVCMASDGRSPLSAGGDGTIRLWDSRTGKCVRRFAGHAGEVNALHLCAFGHRVLSAGADGTLRTWAVSSGECVQTLSNQKAGFTALAVSNDQRYALTGNVAGYFTFWDLKKGSRIRSTHGHQGPITSVALSKDMRFALTAGANEKIRLWECKTGRCIHTFDGEAPINLAVNGRHALSGGGDGAIRLWSVRCDAATVSAPMILCSIAGGQ
ncbi:MAG: protein kinase [Candidatus Hydrogenedentes bacterium]|nr:protein kinase [Candidatus Hydrogenedentota bacterium]